MKVGDVVQCIDINSDLFLKYGEVLMIHRSKATVMFVFNIQRNFKDVNECIVDTICINKIKKAFWIKNYTSRGIAT